MDLPVCVDDIAAHYNVPKPVIVAVAHVEGGSTNQCVGPNRNGTYDCGIMQINTAWFTRSAPAEFVAAEITLTDVITNDCTNVAVGTWILRRNFEWLGNWADAIKAYNTGSNYGGETARNYLASVVGAMKKGK